MSGIDKIKPVNIYNREYLNQSRIKNKTVQNENQQRNKMVNKLKNDNYIYKDPKKVKDNKEVDIDPVKRPISIDESNNIFYINHKAKNQAVKVEPGEYNLTELSNEIQAKVNESFGIGKIKVDLTGSGSDRLVRAKDAKINDFLNNN